jgi:hypothetical protein
MVFDHLQCMVGASGPPASQDSGGSGSGSGGGSGGGGGGSGGSGSGGSGSGIGGLQCSADDFFGVLNMLLASVSSFHTVNGPWTSADAALADMGWVQNAIKEGFKDLPPAILKQFGSICAALDDDQASALACNCSIHTRLRLGILTTAELDAAQGGGRAATRVHCKQHWVPPRDCQAQRSQGSSSRGGSTSSSSSSSNGQGSQGGRGAAAAAAAGCQCWRQQQQGCQCWRQQQQGCLALAQGRCCDG